MPTVAFATCVTLPEPDVDEAKLLAACHTAGIQAETAPWDDHSVDWGKYALVVVRSTWNYCLHETAFREWISQVAAQTPLWNPAEVMLRTIHKSYLMELNHQGIPIVPTRIVQKDAPICLDSLLAETGWKDFVIKPAVSAGSHMTHRFSLGELDSARAWLGAILQSNDAMVQEFMEKVPDGGEISLIHIGGELTHGVIKHPRYAGGEESVSAAVQPSEAQRAMCKAIFNTVLDPLLYARVDLMCDNHGDWVLSELELIEPSLFLSQHPPALQAFVKLVAGKLSGWPT